MFASLFDISCARTDVTVILLLAVLQDDFAIGTSRIR